MYYILQFLFLRVCIYLYRVVFVKQIYLILL